MPHDALLLVSFGGPEGPDDVIPFLENVVRGKNVPRARLEEVARHYERFGGVSPINAQNRALLVALVNALATHGPKLPVYWGNRNWHPLLADVVRQMADDGIHHALAMVTSAFGSYPGCRQYLEDIERARQEVGADAPRIDKLRLFYNHPGFIEAMADRAWDALETIPSPERAAARLLFTAHSIPMAMARNSPYEKQLREACRLVAERLGRKDWQLVYQSRSGPPAEPWLEPDISDALQTLAADGGKGLSQDPGRRTSELVASDSSGRGSKCSSQDPSRRTSELVASDSSERGSKDVVIVPIGFVCEHMEIAYDLDVTVGELCGQLGLNMVRAAVVASHPRFVDMIRELVMERMTENPERRALGTLGPSPDDCPADCCRS